MRRLIASLAVLTDLSAPALPAGAQETNAAPMTSPLPSLTPADLDFKETERGLVLRLDGVITHDVADRFAAAIDGVPSDMPLLLELNSPGGFTKAGYAVIDRILEERENGRAVSTYVRAGESCESMCFGLFMAGFPRYAEAGAEFMVHAPRQLDTGTITVRATGRMIERIRRLGASESWIERVKAAGGFSGRQDYRERAEALASDGSNVVTTLLSVP